MATTEGAAVIPPPPSEWISLSANRWLLGALESLSDTGGAWVNERVNDLYLRSTSPTVAVVTTDRRGETSRLVTVKGRTFRAFDRLAYRIVAADLIDGDIEEPIRLVRRTEDPWCDDELIRAWPLYYWRGQLFALARGDADLDERDQVALVKADRLERDLRESRRLARAHSLVAGTVGPPRREHIADSVKTMIWSETVAAVFGVVRSMTFSLTTSSRWPWVGPTTQPTCNCCADGATELREGT